MIDVPPSADQRQATTRWLDVLGYLAASLFLWSVLILAIGGLLGVLFPGAGTWLISSGSMEPAISAGDLVVTSPHPDENLAAPSVITFELDDKTYTHRIVDTSNDGSGWVYTTQGDANPDPDSTPVPVSTVLGVGRVVVPFIGLPLVWAQTAQWWKLALFALALTGSIWARANLLRDSDDSGDGIDAEPERVSLFQGVGAGALLLALAVAVGIAQAVFSAPTSEAVAVAAGTGFRPAYDTDILSDNPAAYWRLGDSLVGGGTFVDDFTSFLGWNAYGSGNVQAATGVQPDGNPGGLLEKVNNNDPNGGWKDLGVTLDDYSFEVWIYRPSPFPGGAVDRVGIESPGFDGYSLAINHSANTMWIERRNGGSPSTNVTGNISINPPENAWYRMVMAKSGSSFTLEMHDQAGTLLASGSGSDTGHAGGFSRIVVHGGHNYFLDDVAVTGLPTIPAAADSGPNAIDGAYFMPVTLEAAPVIGGDTDTSVDFAGGGVVVPNHTAINSGARPERTLSLWFDVTDTTSRQVLWEEGATINGVNLYVFGGQLYGRAWGDSAGWSNDLEASAPIGPGIHHAALVLDAPAGTLALYLDGVSVASDTKTDPGQLPSHTGAIGIGGVNGNTRFETGNSSAPAPYMGRIDEVAVFNSALPAARVFEHYANGTG